VHSIFSVVVSRVSFSGNYNDTAEVQNSIELILDARVMEANDSISASYVLDSYCKNFAKFVLAVATVVENQLASCPLQSALK